MHAPAPAPAAQREEETALAAHLRAQGLEIDPSLHDDVGGSYEEGDEVGGETGACLNVEYAMGFRVLLQ